MTVVFLNVSYFPPSVALEDEISAFADENTDICIEVIGADDGEGFVVAEERGVRSFPAMQVRHHGEIVYTHLGAFENVERFIKGIKNSP